MLRYNTVSFAVVVLLLIAPQPTNAQRLAQPIGIVAQRSSSPNAQLLAFQSPGETPRWVKWGLVGAVAGGVLFALAGQSNVEGGRSVAGDAFYGAATGSARRCFEYDRPIASYVSNGVTLLRSFEEAGLLMATAIPAITTCDRTM